MTSSWMVQVQIVCSCSSLTHCSQFPVSTLVLWSIHLSLAKSFKLGDSLEMSNVIGELCSISIVICLEVFAGFCQDLASVRKLFNDGA